MHLYPCLLCVSTEPWANRMSLFGSVFNATGPWWKWSVTQPWTHLTAFVPPRRFSRSSLLARLNPNRVSACCTLCALMRYSRTPSGPRLPDPTLWCLVVGSAVPSHTWHVSSAVIPFLRRSATALGIIAYSRESPLFFSSSSFLMISCSWAYFCCS